MNNPMFFQPYINDQAVRQFSCCEPHNFGRNLAQILALVLLFAGVYARATVTSVSIQSPSLSTNNTSAVTTPVHFEATADSDLRITGFAVYVDGTDVYRNSSPSLDAWVV